MKQTVKEVIYDFKDDDSAINRLLSVLEFKKLNYRIERLNNAGIIRVIVSEDKNED